jgi:hypothetical protein
VSSQTLSFVHITAFADVTLSKKGEPRPYQTIFPLNATDHIFILSNKFSVHFNDLNSLKKNLHVLVPGFPTD